MSPPSYTVKILTRLDRVVVAPKVVPTNKLGAWDTEVPDQYGLELSILGRSGCLESKCASEGMAVGKK